MEFEIYFEDLNEDAQQRLLEELSISDPSEMNWDVFPICVYSTELDEDDMEDEE